VVLTFKNELPRGKPAMYQEANALGESGTDPRVGGLNQKENKNNGCLDYGST